MNLYSYISYIRWRVLLAFVIGCMFFKMDASAQDKGRSAAAYMQEVYDYANRNLLSQVQYHSDVYVRHSMHTHRRGQVVRYLPQMFRLERGDNDYLTEAALKIQFYNPGETDCKVVAFHSTARHLKQQRLAETSRFNFQIYAPNLFADRILNPLHRRNRRFYRYVFHYHSQVGTDRLVHIEIKPRFANEQLIKSGGIDVDTENGAVRSFRFEFDYQMQHFTVSGRTGRGFYDSMLPVRMRILSRFRFLGNKVNEVYDVVASHTFSCPAIFEKESDRKLDLTSQCLLRIDTTQTRTDRVFFDSIRPFPLRSAESRIYQMKDSLERTLTYGEEQEKLHQLVTDSLVSSMARGDSLLTFVLPSPSKLLPAGQRTQNLLLNAHTFSFGSSQRATLRLPALITPSMAQWSRSKGLSLQARVRFRLEVPAINGRVEFRPRVGYSFKQKQVYWNVPLTVTFWPAVNGELHLEAGGGSHMYSNRQAEEARRHLMDFKKPDSLISQLDSYGFQFYRDSYMQADFSFMPHPGWKVIPGMRHHRRALLQWNQLAEEAGMKRMLVSLAPRLQVEWTPRQYFYRDGARRIPLYSHFPTFILAYERGFGLHHSPTAYERIEGDIRYRIRLYALRSLYFRTGFGFYPQREKECFLDYDFFRFNNMPSGWDDEMTGEFQLLSARWYNESKHYIRLTSTYESPMLLFSRIPVLSKLIQMERVYCNMLSVRLMRCYTELGYSVSTNLLDVGIFTSFAERQNMGFGVRCAFRFFED